MNNKDSLDSVLFTWNGNAI